MGSLCQITVVRARMGCTTRTITPAGGVAGTPRSMDTLALVPALTLGTGHLVPDRGVTGGASRLGYFVGARSSCCRAPCAESQRGRDYLWR